MTLEMREINGPEVFYNPGRDLAYCYPDMLKLVAQRFDKNAWPELRALCEREKVSYDQLCDAFISFQTSLATAGDNPDEKMIDVLKRTGWFDQNPVAQMAVLAQIGTVVYGQLFHSVREHANDPNKRTLIEEVAAAGLESCKLLRLSPWQRRLALGWRRVQLATAALFGKPPTTPESATPNP